MKIKSLLLTSSLALMLGVASFAGAASHRESFERAEAFGENETWYLSGTFNNWLKPNEDYSAYQMESAGKSGNDFQYHIVFGFDSGAEFKFVNVDSGAWKGLNWMDGSNPPSGGINKGADIDKNVTVSRNLKANMYFKINSAGDYAGLYWSEVFSTITVNSNNNTYGTASASKTSNIAYKENVTLTATPNTGYLFSCWKVGNDVVSSNNPYVAAVTDTTTYTAVFVKELVKLTAPVISNDNGIISWSPVANASGYRVDVNGVTTDLASNVTSYDLRTARVDTYSIKVLALGDNVNYNDSDYSNQIDYVVTEGYYLVGDYCDWGNYGSGANTPYRARVEDGKYIFDSVNIKEGKKVKLIKVKSDNNLVWHDTNNLTLDPVANLHYPIVKDNISNIEAQVEGNYKIEFSNITQTQGSPTVDAKVTALDYVPNYKITIGSTDHVAAVNPGNHNEFYISGVNLKAGDTISYKDDDTPVGDSTAKAIRDNNMTASKQVLFDVNNASIYVDVVAKTIWVSGIYGVYDPGYHLLLKSGSSTRLVAMTNNPEPADPSFIEYYSEAINFSQGDLIRFVDTSMNNQGLTNAFDITRINSGGYGNKFESTANGLRAKVTTSAAVYMKLKSGADEVYFGNVSEELAAAIKFAQDFNTAIKNACVYEGGTDVENTLNPAWQAQVTAFGQLIVKAQNRLKSATIDDSVEDIQNFVKKYIYVAEKYSTKLGNGYNFLEKSLNPKGAAIPGVVESNNNNSSTTFMTSIAAIFITVGASAGFLMIRKKHLK